MEVKIIHNSDTVYQFLKGKAIYDYIYQFANLSSKGWDNVICWGLFDNSKLLQIAMIHTGYDIPVLLAAGFEKKEYSAELIGRIKEYLPSRFYTHIDRETIKKVFPQDSISNLEEYMNMGLCDYSFLDEKNENEAIQLTYNDINDIKQLIAESYPEAWLDDELVKLNENFGIYMDERLISFAGIHAYSEEYQVAAVAHVTTHPDYRKKGYCEKVLISLINDLRGKIKNIGLNVKVDNIPAICCYRKLGFKEFGKFTACEILNFAK